MMVVPGAISLSHAMSVAGWAFFCKVCDIDHITTASKKKDCPSQSSHRQQQHPRPFPPARHSLDLAFHTMAATVSIMADGCRWCGG
jgi:hypothetical protein